MLKQTQINAVNPTDHYSIIANSATKHSESRGFSLVEMMVALVILSVSILGMTSLTLTSIRTNVENDLRNAAIRLTSEIAEEVGAMPIENVVATPVGTPETHQVRIRGTNVAFKVARVVTPLTNDLRQVDITVTYSFKGTDNKSNSAVVYKHRAS